MREAPAFSKINLNNDKEIQTHQKNNIHMEIIERDEKDYRFHAAHLDRGLTIHEAVPGGFNRAGEDL